MGKVLIVGSKGFIGQHLNSFLLTKGEVVFGADVVVDYDAGENYFLIDASNSDFNYVFEKQTFDFCINCSGAASVPDSLVNPIRDYYLNTVNVYKILNAIKRYSPNCKFINLSSAAVYGNPKELPVKEASLRNPMSPYGYHKMMSEQICKEFYKFFNVDTCSLRIFSAYGEGLRKQLFWDLYAKVKKDDSVSLFGTGKESRDFIYIKDLVEAIWIVATKGKLQGQAINIANGKEEFIEDVVNIFYSFFEAGSINFSFRGEARQGDPNNWVADIHELRKLGYQQKYSLEEGLKNYWNWVKENYNK